MSFIEPLVSTAWSRSVSIFSDILSTELAARFIIQYAAGRHGPIDLQGMLSFIPPPIPYGLFKKNSRLPSAASAY
jgi:hypothetical protein